MKCQYPIEMRTEMFFDLFLVRSLAHQISITGHATPVHSYLTNTLISSRHPYREGDDTPYAAEVLAEILPRLISDCQWVLDRMRAEAFQAKNGRA